MAAPRADVNPQVLRWAAERAGLDSETAERTWPKWRAWLEGEAKPTVKQARDLAKRTHVPFGFLLLDEPPVLELPVTDFRAGHGAPEHVRPELLDTVYHCQRVQDWYIDYAEREGAEPLDFPGSARDWGVEETAATIRHALDFTVERRAGFGGGSGTARALTHLVDRFEGLGGLVMRNSVVGNDTHRKLSVDEFRGLSLFDETAPLIFVNTADTKAGQVFSFLHECAHIWRGESGVSADSVPGARAGTGPERWCNSVAAQVLVPPEDLHRQPVRVESLVEDAQRLAGRYCCSELLVLLAVKDAGMVDADLVEDVFRRESRRLAALAAQAAQAKTQGGENFHLTVPVRVGKTALAAILSDVLTGGTSYTETMSLTNLKIGSLDAQLARRGAA